MPAREQRQVSGANPQEAWCVPCQAPPTMPSQGPILGREDRVRAEKGSTGAGGARQVPSLLQPAVRLPEGHSCAGLATQPSPKGALSRHSHLLRRQLCFHIPESQCYRPRPPMAKAKGRSPEDCSAHTPRGSSPVHSRPGLTPARPTPPSGLEGSWAHPTPPFVFG